MKRIGIKEGALLVALLIAVGGFLFRVTQQRTLERIEKETEQTIAQIREIESLKKVWDSKKVPEKLQKIKTILSKESIKHFEMKGKKVEIAIEGLEGRMLNRLLGKLGALPLQVQALDITRAKEKYRLECRCKW